MVWSTWVTPNDNVLVWKKITKTLTVLKENFKGIIFKYETERIFIYYIVFYIMYFPHLFINDLTHRLYFSIIVDLQ